VDDSYSIFNIIISMKIVGCFEYDVGLNINFMSIYVRFKWLCTSIQVFIIVLKCDCNNQNMIAS
jgi:hypothetical protein